MGLILHKFLEQIKNNEELSLKFLI